MLTLSQVALLANLPAQTLKNWVTQGHVTPTVPGRQAPGGQAQFSVPGAVGVVVASELRASARGCAPEWFATVAAAFASVSEEWLLEEFEQGNTHLVTVHQGHPILRAKQYDWPSVKEAYEAVKAKAARRVGRRAVRSAP